MGGVVVWSGCRTRRNTIRRGSWKIAYLGSGQVRRSERTGSGSIGLISVIGIKRRLRKSRSERRSSLSFASARSEDESNLTGMNSRKKPTMFEEEMCSDRIREILIQRGAMVGGPLSTSRLSREDQVHAARFGSLCLRMEDHLCLTTC